MPLATEPIAAGQLSLGLNDQDAALDSRSSPTEAAAAREVANGVRYVIAEALAGESRQMSPDDMSAAFLRDVMRMAAEQNIEISEQDCIHLLNEAIALEASVRTSEMIRRSVKALFATTSVHDTTLSLGIASFTEGGKP